MMGQATFLCDEPRFCGRLPLSGDEKGTSTVSASCDILQQCYHGAEGWFCMVHHCIWTCPELIAFWSFEVDLDHIWPGIPIDCNIAPCYMNSTVDDSGAGRSSPRRKKLKNSEADIAHNRRRCGSDDVRRCWWIRRRIAGVIGRRWSLEGPDTTDSRLYPLQNGHGWMIPGVWKPKRNLHAVDCRQIRLTGFGCQALVCEECEKVAQNLFSNGEGCWDVVTHTKVVEPFKSSSVWRLGRAP